MNCGGCSASEGTAELSDLAANVDFVLAAAARVLAADNGGIPLTRVTQFVVGWMRAAFDRSRIIAAVANGGLAASASPNRRSFAEIVVRLQWIHPTKPEDRAQSLDAMLQHERDLTDDGAH